MSRALALALVTLLLVTATPASAQPERWREAVARLLARRAQAVATGNAAAFRQTMVGAPQVVRERAMTWFNRMQALPIGTYRLELAPESYDDLAPALRRQPIGFDDVHVVHAIERIGFTGFDPEPTVDDLFLTVARTGTRWTVQSDFGLEDIGLLSSKNLWDFGSVRTVRRGPVLVLTRGSRTVAQRIARETASAVARVDDVWPYDWPARTIVQIPSTSDELGRILQTTFDLGPFVAFASSSLHREQGSWELAGHRVFVQPETFFSSPESYQTDTLGHEMLHIATREVTGPWVPAWLDEGLAQVYGEQAPLRFDAVAREARTGRFDGEVPADHEFSVGSTEDIQLSYEESAHIVRWMRGRYGRTSPLRLYRALGAETTVAFGTAQYHLDRAARRVLGTSFRSVERAWAAAVRREF